jgi:hypothetical protein
MECDLPIELLNAYLDGELSEQEKARVETHLKMCAACQEELSALQRVDARIKQEVYEEPSREFVFGMKRRVMERIRPAPRSSLIRFAPIFAPVAAAIIILIVLVEISPSRKIFGVNDRIAYQQVAARQEVQISIPEPRIRTAPASVKVKRMAKAAEEEALDARYEEASAEGLATTSEETRDIDESSIAVPARAHVVRAIIDTTGTIVKVATGSNLVPEQDTILEKELTGQQLAPPKIEGRKKQLYFELAPGEEKEEAEQ